MSTNLDLRAHRRKLARSQFLKTWDLYLLLIPGIIFVLIFSYLPMYGIIIGFKNYNIFAGSSPLDAIAKSPWVGLKNWNQLWKLKDFKRAVSNTLEISCLKIIFEFPLPIILALMINEVRSVKTKRVIQTVLYLPHFMSWVVVAALFLSIFGTSGIVNNVIQNLGGEPQKFFMDNRWFRVMLIISSMWKECGWGTIVYLAAITGIDPELYEAAKVDRANRFQQIIHITLPGIASTVIMMLVMRLGGIMNAGFGQILVMYNPTVYASGDIIGTYVYRIGLGQLNFSRGTIVGLFNSVIGCVLMMFANWFSRRITERSIW